MKIRVTTRAELYETRKQEHIERHSGERFLPLHRGAGATCFGHAS
jgi:hypothetical protein